MTPIDDDGPWLLEEGMTSALIHYVTMGLDPGSFGRAVLQGDYDLAAARAHPLLLGDADGNPLEQNIGRNYIDLIQHCFPTECHGDEDKVIAWIEMGGIRANPDSIDWEALDGKIVLSKLFGGAPELQWFAAMFRLERTRAIG